MDQQAQGGAGDGEPNDPSPQSQQDASNQAEGEERSWGRGASTALDHLRRRNFRGRNSSQGTGEDRPSSE